LEQRGSGEPVRPAEWENTSGDGGEKNVEGETEVKGRTAREAARSEERLSGANPWFAAETLVQISAWLERRFTPERENVAPRRRTNAKARRAHARARR